uniref:cysteine desulfurase n=1 Tax=candidate division WOR-3 bacterium TaxID=2052148 RepID=A0A7C3Z1Y1_UNCW3
MDIEKIRNDFPILRKGVIYLDSAASSLTPEPVINSMIDFYHNFRANVSRGVYEFSTIATEKYEEAHKKVQEFFNAKNGEIIFTKNTTESINIVAFSFPFKKGDKIITTYIEHHSNFLPWVKVSEIFDLELEIIKPDEEGIFNLKDFEDAIDRKTKLIAVNHISNVLGVINDIEGIVEIARKKNVPILVDGAQAAPHIPVDLKSLDVDFYAASGHKMLGPTGTGVLFINDRMRDIIKPSFLGGGTIKDVDKKDYKLVDNYERFEPGTPHIAGGIGLGKACEYLSKIGMENVKNYEHKLTERIVNGLVERGVNIFGPRDLNKRIGVVSFEIENLPPHRVAFFLSENFNIAVRSGHHCAYNILKYIIKREQGTCRASTYIYNTEDEIDKFLEAIDEIKRMGL